jgi:ADYC domain
MESSSSKHSRALSLSVALSVALSLCLAAGACALDDGLAPEPEAEPQPEPEQPWTVAIGKEMQGRHMLGRKMDSLEGDDDDHLFSASTASSGRTVHLVGGAALDTTSGTLPASNGSQLEFTYASSDGDISYYSLRRWDPVKQTWSDPCDGTLAIPLLGSFTRTGLHEATPDRLSFACDDGVAQKCTEWGYPAGSDSRVRNTWRAHQACTQMARADHCADGQSHTREETPISIRDFVGVNGRPPAEYGGVRDWPPPPSHFYYEAAYLDGHKPVFCLGKARWPSIPSDGLPGCDTGDLPDPRKVAGARFCEEYDWEDDGEETGGSVPLPSGADILVVVASAYNDLPIDVWRRGLDFISTVRGYNQGRPTVPPFGGGNWQHVGRDGFLLRVLPGTVDPSDVVLAAIHVNASGDRVLGPLGGGPTGWPPAGYSAGSATSVEGYLFVDDSRIGTTELFLYERPTPGGGVEYLSTAVAPPSGSGYVLSIPDPLGWVIEPTH